MARGQIKKSSVAILATVLMLVGSFSTAYAKDNDKEKYRFTIVRNVTAKNQLSADEQIWKGKDSVYASVKVTSASSPSSYTTYKVYNYDDLISGTKEMKNKANNKCSVKYDYGARNSGYFVNLRGIDRRGTAPNYSTVNGVWSPVNLSL